MRWNRCIAALPIAVLCLSITVAFSAEWSLYFQDKAGNREYIDKNNMQLTPEEKIRVWKRLEYPTRSASEKLIVKRHAILTHIGVQ